MNSPFDIKACYKPNRKSPLSNVKPVECICIFQISIRKIKIFIVFFLYALVEGCFFIFLFGKLFLKYIQ